MRLTKHGHACVRVEHEGSTVVIDPGMFTEPEAVDGADVVLLTHEHPDHVDVANLRRTDAPVLTIAAVAARLRADAPDVAERVRVVAPGESFEAAGVPVTAVGELHAVIHPEMPRFDNSGFTLRLGDLVVHHPGDALVVPDADVDLLLVPSSAPWLKASEAVDFAREVGAPRNLAIHDRIYTDAAHRILAGHMQHFLEPAGQEYLRLADGEDLP
jgi:L-ascorbate metabolism protein UlaG (beta-lactamase superfamily)